MVALASRPTSRAIVLPGTRPARFADGELLPTTPEHTALTQSVRRSWTSTVPYSWMCPARTRNHQLYESWPAGFPRCTCRRSLRPAGAGPQTETCNRPGGDPPRRVSASHAGSIAPSILCFDSIIPRTARTQQAEWLSPVVRRHKRWPSRFNRTDAGSNTTNWPSTALLDGEDTSATHQLLSVDLRPTRPTRSCGLPGADTPAVNLPHADVDARGAFRPRACR